MSYPYGNKKHLPGSFIDLHRMYKTFNSSGSISIISDAIFPHTNLPFLRDIEDATTTECTSQSVISILEDIPSDYTKLILYFSGHCIEGKIMLSDPDNMSLTEIIHVLYENTNITEVVFFCDSCETNVLGVPFYLDFETGGWKLSKEPITFFPISVIVISSIDSNSKSKSTEGGSLFTMALTKFLRDDLRSMKERKFKVLKEVIDSYIKNFYANNVDEDVHENHIQEVKIYSNFVINTSLPHWVLNKDAFTITSGDFSLSSLICKSEI